MPTEFSQLKRDEMKEYWRPSVLQRQLCFSPKGLSSSFPWTITATTPEQMDRFMNRVLPWRPTSQPSFPSLWGFEPMVIQVCIIVNEPVPYPSKTEFTTRWTIISQYNCYWNILVNHELLNERYKSTSWHHIPVPSSAAVPILWLFQHIVGKIHVSDDLTKSPLKDCYWKKQYLLNQPWPNLTFPAGHILNRIAIELLLCQEMKVNFFRYCKSALHFIITTNGGCNKFAGYHRSMSFMSHYIWWL